MRRASGTGSVYKLTGKRHKPWAARVSYWDPYELRRRYKYVGTYQTRKEAQTALEDFVRDPMALTASQVTFSELYAEWLASKGDVSEGRRVAYQAAYKSCPELHDLTLDELTLHKMQAAIDRRPAPSQEALKTVFAQSFRFAVRSGILNDTKDQTSYLTVRPVEKSEIHQPFTQDEIRALWAHKAVPSVAFILIGIYTGARPGELLALKWDDVDLESRTFSIRAGKNQYSVREVPIHPDIVELFVALQTCESDYVIHNTRGNVCDRGNYRRLVFRPALDLCGISAHLPHDTRHTFVTRWTAQGLDEIKLRRIIGHTGKGVAENVYTHLSVEDIRGELERYDPLA